MAEVDRSTFLLRYSVAVTIHSRPDAVWTRLTDAPGHSTWNSTVERIEGDITQGSRLSITVPIAPGRTFRPTVAKLDPPRTMVWRDGMLPMFRGIRTFTLTPIDTETEFRMTEEFSGLMLPLVRRSMPDFRPVFDRYADDLRRACEADARHTG